MGLLKLSPNPPGYPQIMSGYQQVLSTDGSGEKLREMGVYGWPISLVLSYSEVKWYHLNILGRKTSEVSENHLESVVLSEDFGSLSQFLRRYVKCYFVPLL